MIESFFQTLNVYWIQFLELCGLSGFSWWDLPGMLVVVLATLMVIYAFLKAVSCSLSPSEPKYDVVKNQIFDDE